MSMVCCKLQLGAIKIEGEYWENTVGNSPLVAFCGQIRPWSLLCQLHLTVCIRVYIYIYIYVCPIKYIFKYISYKLNQIIFFPEYEMDSRHPCQIYPWSKLPVASKRMCSSEKRQGGEAKTHFQRSVLWMRWVYQTCSWKWNCGIVLIVEMLDVYQRRSVDPSVWGRQLSGWQDPRAEKQQNDVQPTICFSLWAFWKLHPWKLTCPQKRDYFSREYIFQPLIFRGHVSFQGSNVKMSRMPSLFYMFFPSTNPANPGPVPADRPRWATPVGRVSRYAMGSVGRTVYLPTWKVDFYGKM